MPKPPPGALRAHLLMSSTAARSSGHGPVGASFGQASKQEGEIGNQPVRRLISAFHE